MMKATIRLFRLMQAKSDSKSDFSDRTDALAAKLRLRVVDLPSVIGISADMLMGYRSGRYKISNKAWKKLEAAEVANGLAPPPPSRPPIEILCERIRSEFYLPSDSDFVGLTQSERAMVFRAMADSLDEMERRSAAYAARAVKEGCKLPARAVAQAAAAAVADQIIAGVEAEVKGSHLGKHPHSAIREAS